MKHPADKYTTELALVNKDYRLQENRREYFDALYAMNLEHGVMPGLVYLYMPKLAEYFGWDDEQKLWFAVINGCTQNPITSLVMFNKFPEPPATPDKWRGMDDWFNAHWSELQFDTDRRYQKKDTVKALFTYWKAVKELSGGSQARFWTGLSFDGCWSRADAIQSFGRLSKFSYLEYVYIMGFGSDCDRMFFDDKSGSKSHRNGMLFLLGQDELVWDKRQPNSHSGDYPEFKKMCGWLESQASAYLERCAVPGASRFTMESNLCTTKNHYFGRRYPGVYADMAWERIQKYDGLGFKADTEVFKAIRAAHLPRWLRAECDPAGSLNLKQRAAVFPETGFPYRGERFLGEPVPPSGYTAEELERDNPYNTWMYEQ